jgi:FkbM family methyltransferase
MPTNTRTIFKALLRRHEVDCNLDIGSCDGTDSLRFRRIFPAADIFAFEANPFLYRAMAANPLISENRITIFPFAVTNYTGVARFHVTDLNYEDAGVKNPGTSSLLVREDLKIQETVAAQTCRIDEFVLSHCSTACRVGLWIDVEGAELAVLEGMAGIKERVVAVHVETARTPMRLGQKVFSEVEQLMKSFGFVLFATNMSSASSWGDVVFVKKELIPSLGSGFIFWQALAKLSYWSASSKMFRFLYNQTSPLYRLYERLFR